MRVVWKLLGVAGLVGVAASGAVMARHERERRHYTPGEIRTRLHARYDEAQARGVADEVTSGVMKSASRRDGPGAG